MRRRATTSRRARPAPARAVAAGLALATAGALALAGCGDDDTADGDGGSAGDDGESQEEGVTDDDWPRADGVTLDATPAAADRHVRIEFTLTNTGDVPVAVVDPADTPDRVASLDGGAVRVSYLGTEGAPGGGDAVPPGEGVLLAPGASHSGTARALGRGEDVPPELEMCVEVVADFFDDDDGDGRVTFPYRPTDEAPTVACSDRRTVG